MELITPDLLNISFGVEPSGSITRD